MFFCTPYLFLAAETTYFAVQHMLCDSFPFWSVFMNIEIGYNTSRL